MTKQKLDLGPLSNLGKNMGGADNRGSRPSRHASNPNTHDKKVFKSDTRQRNAIQIKGNLPYDFIVRETYKPKLPPLHDKLDQNRFDLAFEVEWELVTPTALNPCNDDSTPSSEPNTGNNEFSGYNKRWLTIDESPAISPFTVKSAIANGFANLMGGCYRVTTTIEGHKKEYTAGNYPYNGTWKRHRVERRFSKLGIIKSLEKQADDSRRISIQPALPRPGKPIPKHGESMVTGVLRKELFQNADDLTKIVYMGGIRPKKCKFPVHAIWYEDLRGLKVGDAVYYQAHDGRVSNIGLKFMFKPLFCHTDAVPINQRACKEMNNLCPRCALFGMANEGKTSEAKESSQVEREAVGFRGRFKAGTLVSPVRLQETEPRSERVRIDDKTEHTVDLKQWMDSEGNMTAYQLFLPNGLSNWLKFFSCPADCTQNPNDL